MKKVLIAGESWITHSTHVKGFDIFNTCVYEEGVEWLRKALEAGGYEVDFIPNHEAPEKFPWTLDEINKYDAVILSDIGSNTLLLSNATFARSERRPNRCQLIKEYVKQGGGFLMVGGYMSFTGIDAKARYGETEIADILPVKMVDVDDRVEAPEGIYPEIVDCNHEVMNGISPEWPFFLGYNKTAECDEGKVIAKINNDPFIAVREYGKGRTAVFTSDCAPHWGPTEFVNWESYSVLWNNIMNWLTE